MIEIKGLTKNYGRFAALSNFDAKIEAGSAFGLVGPNGAGKTTVIKIIMGLIKPTSGEVLLNGESILKNHSLINQKIGYMPDFFGVYDNLKVIEYLDFYAGMYYIPYKDRPQIFDRLLGLAKLAEKKDAYVDTLSRGMKQRLCLVRALIHDPDILILDEPASGLDPRARVEIKEVLKELNRAGKTIIISSHILPEVSEICTDIGIMEAGALKACGSIKAITDRLSGKRSIRVVPLERPYVEHINRILTTYFADSVSLLPETDRGVEFSFSGDDAELSHIIAKISSENIPLLSFGENQKSLEEVFMSITKGGSENA